MIYYLARRTLEKQLADQTEISDRLWQELKSFPEFEEGLRLEQEELASLASDDDRRRWWQRFVASEFEMMHRWGESNLDRICVLRKAFYVSKCREQWYRLCLARRVRQHRLSLNPILAVGAALILHYLGLSWIVASLTGALAILLYAIYKTTRAVLELLLSFAAESTAARKMEEDSDWGWRVPIDARLHLENLMTGREMAFPPIPFASEVVLTAFNRKAPLISPREFAHMTPAELKRIAREGR